MSLTSDSGACSVSSSEACPRDNSDPEEEEDDEAEYDDEEFQLDVAAAGNEAEAAAAAAAFLGTSGRIDDGIEFVNDPEIFAAAAAAAAAANGCGRQRRRNGAGRARGNDANQQNSAGRQSSRGSGSNRTYSHHRERVRRERFIDLYGKLQTAVPNLQGIKRATHRKILTETAAYLANTIAQIKARRRVSKLRALLAQLESDASYVRRLSGTQRHRPVQPEQQQQQFGHASSSSVQRLQQLIPDESPTVLAIGDCFLIG
ncbi:hypothetical protein BOX15_Mlig025782g7 [Macrostomum lignano]|uniref:BHLH domain-containing protein n=2 Tax=Macrostomum lignano TaxID=282301 RepID=A0A267DCG6_9PLAT|nr:hypothetical protein BOX15_Mlig025782g5 [Macrostomum lignano]PAA48115.1 hypothetical protein BOX15_Mlig025782g2 [Macrostomum lignano]PAA73971.1 hypothetical protein BOX15_Mlig025782g7 [Macrostomum lignano]